MGLELYCQGCDTTGEHDVDGQEAVCLSCGTVREVEPELLAGVVDVEFCGWCRRTLPVGHKCPAPACESRTHLTRCGRCKPCLDLQGQSLAARAQSEAADREQAVIGGPSDLDHP